MATLAELGSINNQAGYDALFNNVRGAVKRVAAARIDASASAAEIAWAQRAVLDSTTATAELIQYVIAAAVNANETITVAQIMGASDAAIKTHVETAVAKIYAVAP